MRKQENREQTRLKWNKKWRTVERGRLKYEGDKREETYRGRRGAMKGDKGTSAGGRGGGSVKSTR